MRITVVGGDVVEVPALVDRDGVPLVRPWDAARDVLDALLAAHARYLPRFGASGVR